MTIQEKLFTVQQKLKVTKSNYNEFGKYSYRSAEDIEAAVKPLLAEAKCVLTLKDELILIGNRYYVEATASITDFEGNSISVKAYAREEEVKKGMDASQITGAVSSYARKYALSGLFAIDNTKDADTMDNTEKKPKEDPVVTKEQIKALETAIKAVPGSSPYEERLAGCLKRVGCKTVEEMKNSQFTFLMQLLEKNVKKMGEKK